MNRCLTGPVLAFFVGSGSLREARVGLQVVEPTENGRVRAWQSQLVRYVYNTSEPTGRWGYKARRPSKKRGKRGADRAGQKIQRG